MTQQDKQIIAQSIQASIAEAKAAITLNPQKASHWENLAGIYRGIIKTAEDADAWTISSYQRAISLDPRNPSYRLSLGGVHYSLGNYESAISFFEQAVNLKPDWSNAYYNLAWAAYNVKDYTKAIKAMEKVVSEGLPSRVKAGSTKLEDFAISTPTAASSGRVSEKRLQ